MRQGPRPLSVAALRLPASLRSLQPVDPVPATLNYFRFDVRFDVLFFLPPVFLRPLVLRLPLDFRFDGTLSPFFRASDNPIAIASFLLFTLPPFPPRPLRNVPFFRFFIARSTLFPAAFPYLRPLFLRVAMSDHPSRWWVVHARRAYPALRSKGCASQGRARLLLVVLREVRSRRGVSRVRGCLPAHEQRYIVPSSTWAAAQ
jgi:hypothetical protein